MENYDVIIVGTGAGGGTLGYALATAGLKILFVERGSFLPREKENWDPSALFLENRYLTDEEWIDKKGHRFKPGQHYYVGGNTKFYGAALLRLRERDFEEIKHQDGVSPEWPLKYEDFKPYYLEAETLYTVHGARGTDPTEPPEDQPYPCPPLRHEPQIKDIYDTLIKKGIRAFTLPVGIRLDEKNRSRSQCIRCDTCDGFPCLVDAKADAHTTCIVPALKYPNVTLLTQAKVKKLHLDPTGKKINEIEVQIESRTERFRSDIVIVSCGAANSAALLLKSQVPNRSGMLGRHYMCHNNSAIIALSRTVNTTKFQKTIGINDYYFGAPNYPFPLGHMQLLGKVKMEMILADLPRLTPEFPLETIANHSIGWWITTEDLPDPNNRVTLDTDGTIQLHYQENNLESHRQLFSKLKEVLSHIGYDHHIFPNNAYFRKKVPIAGVAHQVGTCRFGSDPAASVLDIHCKHHDLDNLYVVDGSFFPSSGAVNPGLTIIANALRIADHLCERLNKKRAKNLRCDLEGFYNLPYN